jgi:hypothetical protein
VPLKPEHEKTFGSESADWRTLVHPSFDDLDGPDLRAGLVDFIARASLTEVARLSWSVAACDVERRATEAASARLRGAGRGEGAVLAFPLPAPALKCLQNRLVGSRVKKRDRAREA